MGAIEDRLKDLNIDLPAALGSKEWETVFAKVPGGRASYLRTEAKFTEALL